MAPLLRCHSARFVTVNVAVVCSLFIRVLIMLSRADVSEESATIPRAWILWPYSVASTIFACQAFVCGLIAFNLRPIIKSSGHGDLLLLARFERMAMLLCFTAMGSSFFYAMLMMEPDVWQVGHNNMLFSTHPTPRNCWRYLYWALLAPGQWIVYGWMNTLGDQKDVAICALQSSAGMLLGGLTSGAEMSCPQRILCFAAGLFLCFDTFKRAMAMKPQPQLQLQAKHHQRLAMMLWTAYPCVHVARDLGWLTYYQEQIISYTVLDVVAKSVSVLYTISGPLLKMIVNSVCSLQTSHAVHDLFIMLEDPSWEILPSSKVSPLQMARQTHMLGEEQGVGVSFLDYIRDTAQRVEVLNAAARLDAEPHFMAHKVLVTLHVAEGRKIRAECFVSRSMFSKRQLVLTVLEDSFGELPALSYEDSIQPQMFENNTAFLPSLDEESVYSGVSGGSSSIGPPVQIFRMGAGRTGAALSEARESLGEQRAAAQLRRFVGLRDAGTRGGGQHSPRSSHSA